MPITLAHPAAVLPLRGLHLPLAAMVLGSMVPDVPLFMGWASDYALWDAFTHPDRWGVTHLAWLRADLGPLAGFTWAQYLSGVLGMGAVLWAVIADLRSRPAGLPSRRRTLPAPVLPAVILAAGTYGIVAGLGRADDGLHAVAFHGVVQTIIATCGGLLVICAAWGLTSRSHALRS